MFQGNKFVPGYNHKFLSIQDVNSNSQALNKFEQDIKEDERPSICTEIIKEFYGNNRKVEDKKINKIQQNVALDFLDECSYSIDLKNLYRLTDDSQISGTCAYNQEMEYVPVQIQIASKSKCLYKNDNWLLQVWDSKGIRKFELSMKYMVSQWAICFEYFIFKTLKTRDSNDESNYFQIINLKNNCKTLVEDFILDPSFKYFAYNNGKFYAANSEKIKVAAVKLTTKPNNTVKRKVNPSTVATITLWDSEKEKKDINKQFKGKYGQKIHGLAVTSEGFGSDINKKDFVYVFLEIFGKGGNRISMNELSIDIKYLPPYHDYIEEGSLNVKKQFYSFTESREFLFVGQDGGQEDPIIKYQFIFKKDNIHVGVAQRESKSFDIYFNGNWIDDASSKDANGLKNFMKCETFQVTYSQIYFEHLDEYNKPYFKTLNHNLYYDNAKTIQGSLLSSNLFFTERIKNHVKLFSGVLVIETNIFVSHGKNVSQYYLKNNKFELRDKHFSFQSNVKFMFKIMSKDSRTGLDKFNVGILLDKGHFKILKSNDNTDYSQWEEHQFANLENIPGEIISCSNDPVQYKCNLFLANIKKVKKGGQINEIPLQNEDEIRAYIFNGKVHDITQQLNKLGVKIDKNDQMVGMYEKDLLDPFFVFYQCKLKKLLLFKTVFKVTEIFWDEEINQLRVVKSQQIFGKQETEPVFFMQKKLVIQWIEIQKVSEIKFSPLDIIKNDFDIKTDSKRQVWQDSDQKNFKIIQSVVHHNFILIFSNINCYKISIEKDQQFVQNSISLIPELCWKTFYISNLKSIYLIMDQEDKTQKGVCYFDLERFLDQKKDQNKKFKDLATWLQFAQIGVQSCVDYGQGIERLAYIKSYSEINLLPNLHLNQVSLIDQKHYEEYLAIRSYKDAFYAILNEKDTYYDGEDPNKMVSTLITWDIVTGKKKHSNRCDMLKGNYDFTNYERFKPKNFEMQLNGLYERTLLVEKKSQPFNENLLEQYFEQESIKPIFPNQIRYVKSERDKKQLFKFRMIQIIDSETIEQQYEFIHPKYEDQQAIYINQSNDKMIEWLSNDRVTFYDRQDEETEKNAIQKIRWQKIRRMENLYTIYGRPDYLINVSVDFRLFIDVNKAQKQFIIRDMFTEEEILKIPHYLMSYDKDPLETILRVKWIGNEAIKIINSEGMEKIFEISASDSGEFKQLGYNQVCNFDNEIEKSRNFYIDRKELTSIDVTERLIRKCQNYKSNRFLGEIEFLYEEKSMYEFLFTIDYQATRALTKKFFTDMSFSFITWKNIEELRDGELQIEDLDDESIKKICFTILPGGLNFLHILYNKPKIIEKIFQKALVNHKNPKNLKYSIPYLQEMNRNCPIDYSVDGDEYITINILLKYLAHQPIDHHSRDISQHLALFLNNSLSNFAYYIKNSKKQNSSISQFTRQGLNKENETGSIIVTDQWVDKNLIKEKLFSDEEKGSDIQIFYTDLLYVHEFSDISKEFFEAMAETDDLEIFDQLQIQNLINFKWPIVKRHMLIYAVLPAILYLLSTCIYTSTEYIYHYKMIGKDIEIEGLQWFIRTLCEELIMVFSLYFLALESLQIKQDPFNYFLSFWNYMDIIPPVFQIGLSIYNYFDILDESGKLTEQSVQINAVIMSITTLCLWIKFLYFFRIFDDTGFLIRAIIFCISKMQWFLLILLVTICAFADSYKVMSFANRSEDEIIDRGDKFDEKKPEQFVEGNFIKSVFYAYLIGLGEFPLDSEFGKVAPLYCNILFVLNTIITTIIMLNLFIAIISNAFDQINTEGIKASYREKAGLITENEFLISTDSRNEWVKQGQFILFVQDISKNPIEEVPDEE